MFQKFVFCISFFLMLVGSSLAWSSSGDDLEDSFSQEIKTLLARSPPEVQSFFQKYTQWIGSPSIRVTEGDNTPFLDKHLKAVLKDMQKEQQEERYGFYNNSFCTLRVPMDLDQRGYEALEKILRSPDHCPYELILSIPFSKKKRQCFRRFLSNLHHDPMLETLEIAGLFQEAEAKTVADFIGQNSPLQTLKFSSGLNFYPPSVLAPIAKAMKNNFFLEIINGPHTFNGPNTFFPNHKWGQMLGRYNQRNQEEREERRGLLCENNDLFKEKVRGHQRETTPFNRILTTLMRDHGVRTDRDLIPMLPPIQNALCDIILPVGGSLWDFDGVLMGRLYQACQAFQESYSCLGSHLEHFPIKQRYPSWPKGNFHGYFENPLFSLLFKDSSGDFWENLGSIFARGDLAYEETGFKVWVQAWKERHEKRVQGIRTQGGKTIFPQEILDPRHTVKHDVMNLKRTLFYEQTRTLFLKTFLFHEALAFGSFSRRVGHPSTSVFPDSNQYLYTCFPGDKRVAPGFLGYARNMKTFIPLCAQGRDAVTQERLLRLSSLHNHSFEKMEEISALCASVCLYRYHHLIPCFKDHRSYIARLHVLVPWVVAQMVDYAFQSEGELDLDRLIFEGFRHIPSWIESLDQQEQFLGWAIWNTPQRPPEEGTYFFRGAEPLHVRDLMGCTEIKTVGGHHFELKKGGVHCQSYPLSSKKKFYRRGIAREVEKSAGDFQMGDGSCNGRDLDPTEEKAQFIEKAQAYVRKIWTTPNDLLPVV